MAFRIEERFRIDAPPDRVWAYLVDPERVVGCLPGAELLDRTGEDEFEGRIKVSVGPVSVAYRGTATFGEMDAAARRVRVEARGEEASGPGSASMTMESTVTEADGGSEVLVTADVEVAGKIVQFGRGMIETVSGQLFRQFTDCARSTLESPERGPEGGERQPGAATTDPSPPAVSRVGDGADGGATDGKPRPGGGRDGSSEPDEGSLSLIPLLFSALTEKLRALFGGGR